MGIKEKLHEVFVQAEGLARTQAEQSAREYREKSPATLAREQQPRVPQGEAGREFSVAYYNRDTKRDPLWQYTTEEGGIAEVSPQKYMDGTPMLKKPENARVPSELLPAINGLPTDPSAWYFGPRNEDGSVPDIPGLGTHGASHVPRNVYFTAPAVEGGDVILGGKALSWKVVRDCEPADWKAVGRGEALAAKVCTDRGRAGTCASSGGGGG
eukprot:CAMPEP_0114141166 /NCGR_PEP_ID=MMETSP0043_2-20121206/17767_1 /TAXON_ID=464988 /ORGANISM="Hemiselmis andersenii, Strain CCMP644" /LENGTH=211 /DNA_ID=CAMNT_0001235297 /DNA_START=127 /DNA_END=759 /DNA_ORIENTATION=+